MKKKVTLTICLLSSSLNAEPATYNGANIPPSIAASSYLASVLANGSTTQQLHNEQIDAQAKTTDALYRLFTRADGQSYFTGYGNHFMNDLFDFYKYNRMQQEQKESYLFYMTPPSLSIATNDFKLAKSGFSFVKNFSYITKPSQTGDTINNFVYKNNADSYSLFHVPLNINTENLTTSSSSFAPTKFLRTGKPPLSSKTELSEYIHAGTSNSAVVKHYAKYCPTNMGKECTSIVEKLGQTYGLTTNSASTSAPDADLNPQVILADSSISSSSNLYDYGTDYIRWVSDPIPKLPLPYASQTVGDTTTIIPDTGDVVSMAKNLADRSTRALSQYVLNQIRNRHVTPTGDDTTALSQIQYFENEAYGRTIQGNDWLAKLNSTSTEGILREIAMIEANRLLLDYVKLRQQEHLEALLSVMVAQNQNIMDTMNFAGNNTSATSTQNTINAITNQ